VFDAFVNVVVNRKHSSSDRTGEYSEQGAGQHPGPPELHATTRGGAFNK